jgi:P27 family predicted phage terminase small subunit
MGRPAQPKEVKRLLGHAEPDAPMPDDEHLPAQRESDGPPEPPYPLEVTGQYYWVQTWSAGKSWLSPDVDLQIVYDICANRDECARIQDEIEKLPARFYETKAGQLVTHPLITQLRALETQRTAWMAAIGFSPADRARLGLAEVRIADELDALNEKRRQREARDSED